VLSPDLSGIGAAMYPELWIGRGNRLFTPHCRFPRGSQKYWHIHTRKEFLKITSTEDRN
jgi:hypothetical protein